MIRILYFFHGILKRKRRQLVIRDVLVNGLWVDEPPRVKNEFHMFYQSLFSKEQGKRPKTGASLFCTLSQSQIQL